MVSTRKKRQSNRRLLSQLDDFDEDMIIGNTASERQDNTVVNEGTNDQDFTVGTSKVSSTLNGSVAKVKILERCFNERIDREMANIVDTVEDRIQNAILTAIDNIIAPKIELAIRSINASSGRDAASVSVTSERKKQLGISAPFGSASGSNDTLGISKVNDETRNNFADEVSELSFPETRFDRQSHTHHKCCKLSDVLSYKIEELSRIHPESYLRSRHLEYVIIVWRHSFCSKSVAVPALHGNIFLILNLANYLLRQRRIGEF